MTMQPPFADTRPHQVGAVSLSQTDSPQTRNEKLARIELEIPTHRELGIAMRSWDRASLAAKAYVETVRTWVAAWDERVEFVERWDNLG